MLGASLLVQGCAGLAPGRGEAPAPTEHPAGRFTVEQGRPGLVIGAPHGSSDSATDLIGLELARRTGWGAVVAVGFSRLDGSGRRLNVNRPTESAPGEAPGLETDTAAAREAYELYRRHVAAAAQGPLRLYVEVHGNSRRESEGRIEVATVGLDRDAAWRLKILLELQRDARLRGRPGAIRLEVLVEPLDQLFYTARAAKQRGLLRAAERALHIELPRVARTSQREAYTAVLAEFLVQAAGLLAPAGR